MSRTYRRNETTKEYSERREALDELISLIEESELEEYMDTIYIIVQAYKPYDSEYELMEILGAYHLTKTEARDALRFLAADHDIEIESDQDSFEVPTPEIGLEYDIYYIEELIRG